VTTLKSQEVQSRVHKYVVRSTYSYSVLDSKLANSVVASIDLLRTETEYG
jgi:hypothetical protein